MAGLGERILLGAAAGGVEGYTQGLIADKQNRQNMQNLYGKMQYDALLTEARDRARFDRESGTIVSVKEGADGSMVGITKTGGIMPLGLKGKGQGQRTKDSDIRQAYSDAVKTYTQEEPYGTGFGTVKKTDWGKVQQAMVRMGPEYASYANSLLGQQGGGEGGGVPGMDQETAFERAKAEAEDKAGYFSTDSTDFKDYGGSREQYVTTRAQELMGEGKPRGASPKVQKAVGSPKDAKPLPASKNELQPNTWYITQKGPLFWDGSQWMAPSNPAAAASDESVNSALRGSHKAD